MAKGSSIKEHLDKKLLNPEFAAAYLAAAMEEGDEEFLNEALSKVVRLNGINDISSEVGISRQSIYKMLSKSGNPSFKNIWKMLEALGFELTIKLKHG
jgi:probable addiction module antidote protein